MKPERLEGVGGDFPLFVLILERKEESDKMMPTRQALN
jgi:hypothetical protein